MARFPSLVALRAALSVTQHTLCRPSLAPHSRSQMISLYPAVVRRLKQRRRKRWWKQNQFPRARLRGLSESALLFAGVRIAPRSPAAGKETAPTAPAACMPFPAGSRRLESARAEPLERPPAAQDARSRCPLLLLLVQLHAAGGDEGRDYHHGAGVRRGGCAVPDVVRRAAVLHRVHVRLQPNVRRAPPPATDRRSFHTPIRRSARSQLSLATSCGLNVMGCHPALRAA